MTNLLKIVNSKLKKSTKKTIERWEIIISGIVQGVGFRPFVTRAANLFDITGSILNRNGEVFIEAQGSMDKLISFTNFIWEKSPAPAKITDLKINKIDIKENEGKFIIIPSVRTSSLQPANPSPDLAICPKCKQELFQQDNSRYLHPFISCTNCGPRYTINYSTPFDRHNTSMAPFRICQRCSFEYSNVSDRRFHSQTNCCHLCGPSISIYSVYHPDLCVSDTNDIKSKIKEISQLLDNNGILLVKGLGGYHLACLATSSQAVIKLRQLKKRPKKPLAIMVKDLQDAYKIANIAPEERRLLTSQASPIVLLKKRQDSALSPLIAPGSSQIGVMLAYTPIHQILLQFCGKPLVMTSGNLRDFPIEYLNREANKKLAAKVDVIIDHDREIINPCDDSVVRVVNKQTVFIRRSRGYVPESIELDFDSPPMLACGGDIKSTFCLAKDRIAFMGPYNGDLSKWDNFKRYVENIKRMAKLLNIKPQIIAHDTHPQYKSTKYALSEIADQTVGVQHHHAHIASCLIEKKIPGPVIGVSFDGSGWGTDSTVWGGEFLVADRKSFTRAAHLRKMPMPGGNICTKKPYRIALATACILNDRNLAERIKAKIYAAGHELSLIERQIAVGVNTFYTSSMGRLFDMVAALIDLSREVSYEGEAASELEDIAAPCDLNYEFDLNGNEPIQIDYEPLLRQIMDDLSFGIPADIISSKFHNAVIQMINKTVLSISAKTGIDSIVLGGGVFQNKKILEGSVRSIEQSGLKVYFGNELPVNDNGLAAGQIAVANQIISHGGEHKCA